MRIVVGPDSFKGTLSAIQACAAIAEGLRRVLPDAEINEIPLADGGEGTLDALLRGSRGDRIARTVSDPLSRSIVAHFGLLHVEAPTTSPSRPGRGDDPRKGGRTADEPTPGPSRPGRGEDL